MKKLRPEDSRTLSKFTFSELKIHVLSHFVGFRLLLSMSHWRKKMDDLEEVRRRSILSIRAGPFMTSIQNAWISSPLGRQVGLQDRKGPAQKLWGRQESPWLSSPAPGRLARRDFGNCFVPLASMLQEKEHTGNRYVCLELWVVFFYFFSPFIINSTIKACYQS